MKRTIIASLLAGTALALAPAAAANPVPDMPNCDRAVWGFLGSQVRLICDTPVRADGSWDRSRVVATPAHTTPQMFSCSGGAYTSFCTSYGGQFVPLTIQDNETYRVTADTVLPDEPGHLGGPAPSSDGINHDTGVSRHRAA